MNITIYIYIYTYDAYSFYELIKEKNNLIIINVYRFETYAHTLLFSL